MAIGAKPTGNGTEIASDAPGYWHGAMDELAIFDRALTPDEIGKYYEVSKPR